MIDILKANEITTALRVLAISDPTQQVRNAARRAMDKLIATDAEINSLMVDAQNTGDPQGQVDAIKELYEIVSRSLLNIS